MEAYAVLEGIKVAGQHHVDLPAPAGSAAAAGSSQYGDAS